MGPIINEELIEKIGGNNMKKIVNALGELLGSLFLLFIFWLLLGIDSDQFNGAMIALIGG